MKTCTSGSRRTSSMVTAIYLTSKPERDSSGSASATSTRLTRAAAHVPGPPAQPQALALPASARPVVHAVHRPAHADRDRLHHGDLLLAGSSDRGRDLWRPRSELPARRRS